MKYVIHYCLLLGCVYHYCYNYCCDTDVFVVVNALSMSSPLRSSHPKGTQQSITTESSCKDSKIYVSGLNTLCKEELTIEFAKYGKVQSIDIYNFEDETIKPETKKKRKRREPFAFVTFESRTVAKQIVSKFKHKPTSNDDSRRNDGTSNSPLFSIVDLANPYVPTYSKRVRKSLKEQEQIIELCQNEKKKPSLLLQVTSSHLNRVLKYINDLGKQEKETSNNKNNDEENPLSFPLPTIIGSTSSITKNISFIYLHIDDTDVHTTKISSPCAKVYWHNYFASDPTFIRFGVRKIYIVDRMVKIPVSKQANNSTERTNLLVHHAMENILSDVRSHEDNSNLIFKVQTFPPKRLQHKTVESLDRKIDDFIIMEQKKQNLSTCVSPPILSMSSTDYTHILSCVQLFYPQNDQSKNKSEKEVALDEIFMVGVVPLSSSNDKMSSVIVEMEKEQEEDKEICRAYFKLKEVMDNYRRDEKEVSQTMDFTGIDAFDCGSSPGGWTKYLLETEQCKTCYSCDPGELHASVTALKGTRHLKIRGIDAIDVLQNEGKQVSLWVSDMCLFDPKQQVDHLILAKNKGILKDDGNTFFVLTLKFNTGHGKDTFDMFAKNELKRLQESIPVTNVRTYHLFSNRKGERTLIGKLA